MPSLNVLLKTTPKPSFTKCSGFASVWVLILLVLMFGILGTFGYLFLNRLTEIERRMVGLDQQMEEVVQKVEEAIETSKAASLKALQAEEHALEAARGRAQAEEDKGEAEQDSARLAVSTTTESTQDGAVSFIFESGTAATLRSVKKRAESSALPDCVFPIAPE